MPIRNHDAQGYDQGAIKPCENVLAPNQADLRHNTHTDTPASRADLRSFWAQWKGRQNGALLCGGLDRSERRSRRQ
jgi:hypothetical protein